jgi:5-deoxy-D-glucuronate isomerase
MVVIGYIRRDTEQRQETRPRLVRKSYKAGSTIVNSGSEDENIFFLLKGKVAGEKDGVRFMELEKPMSPFGELEPV